MVDVAASAATTSAPHGHAEAAWRAGPWILRALAEGGWLSVVYAFVAVGFETLDPAIGPLEFAGFVGLGMAIAALADRNSQLAVPAVIVATVGSGVAGWLLSGAARTAFGIDPVGALTVHGVGWLAALAVARGVFIGRRGIRAPDHESLLTRGLPLLAVIWAIAALLIRPSLWASFAAVAFWGTTSLIAAALVGLGLRRLEQLEVGRSDPRLRRQWRVLTFAAGLAVVPVALPFGALTGISLAALFEPLTWPLRILLSLFAIPFGYFAAWLIGFVRQFPEFFRQPDPASDSPPQISTSQDLPPAAPSDIATVVGIAVVIVALLIVAWAALELAGWLLRRNRDPYDLNEEAGDGLEHSFAVPSTARRRPSAVGGRRRLGAPSDAVAAYLGALEVLDGHPDYGRTEAETPAAHAARVRLAGMPGSSAFARLAAAYQVARYAGRPITSRENGRSVARFQRLRKLLRTA